jgi:NTE family protein
MPIYLKDVIKPFENDFKNYQIDPHKISNIVADYNGEKLPFVDLVTEGGGVKGIAVTGACYALERLGIRFRKIAGTSAGAINTVLVAASGNSIADKRVEKISNIALNMDLMRFVDGGRSAQAFVQAIMDDNQSFLSKLNRMVSFTRNIDNVVRGYGINPGKHLYEWLDKTLSILNGGKTMTVGDLRTKMRRGPHGIVGDVQLITSDITNRRKAVFPRDLRFYFNDPKSVRVSDLVRTSISIPFFFEPWKIKDFAYEGGFADNSDLINNENTTFVDGAMVSNFPLGIFDVPPDKIPAAPTFGILFDTKNKSDSHEINSIIDYGLALIETMNDYGDRAYLRETQADSRIIKISNRVQGKTIKTIYFNLTDDEIISLFGNGIRAAFRFIENWDFQEYLYNIRSKR